MRGRYILSDMSMAASSLRGHPAQVIKWPARRRIRRHCWQQTAVASCRLGTRKRVHAEVQRCSASYAECSHRPRHRGVDRQTGGKNGGGAALTPFGLWLVARYRKIERDAASAVRKELKALRADIGRTKKAANR